MPKSAYIHVPYCSSKCHYCSFVSFCDRSSVEKYLDCLDKEINHYYDGEALKTIYTGGGTPSSLKPFQIKNILDKFSYDKFCEKTIELNPEDIDNDYLSQLYDVGINRISLGCQTFDDEILKTINRRHNSKKVKDSVRMAQKIGFKNISLDFIYGLPNQTLRDFLDNLNEAVELDIAHISLYGLKIEEGCYFYKNPPKNLPDDDMQADMYLAAIENLINRGFEHYEVSNFSKPGFRSKHNLTYWKNEEYYGFGVAAHGYKNGIRYENKINIKDYLENPFEHRSETKLTKKDKLEEEIFLGFRIMDGIDVQKINQIYGCDFKNLYKDVLEKYLKYNLILPTQNGYKLSPNGILVSNDVLADFLLD